MTMAPESERAKRMTRAEFEAEGKRLFGDDPMDWRFECPCCHHVASVREWKEAGAPESMVAFSCIGRLTGAKQEAFATGKKRGKGPCNYAGGGLFRLNPMEVEGSNYFAFAQQKQLGNHAAAENREKKLEAETA